MLFGASCATLSIYLLLKNKQKPFSNNLLALLLFAWGFSCYWFFAFISDEPLFSVSVTTFIGPMLAMTLFPPVYLYVKYLYNEQTKFKATDHLHFLPIYIYILFTLYLYIDNGFSIPKMREDIGFQYRRIACSYIATIQGPFYFFKTNQILKLIRQKLEVNYSEIESRKLEWFQKINFCFASVFIIGGISALFKTSFINPYFLYMGYHAIIALSLFYIATIIYKYPFLFKLNQENKKVQLENSNLKKSQSILTNEELKEELKEDIIIEKIHNIMIEQHLYRNPNFSLNDLASAISESRNSISYVLNNHLNKSFYNYINELRVEESTKLLSDPNLQHYSIEGIATLSGFKSMSVFYRFFKDVQKVTPAVYRKKAINT